MTTQTWINITYIIVLIGNIIALINSYKFGMKYYNRVMNVLSVLPKLRIDGKIDYETMDVLLKAVSSDKYIGDSVDEKKEH